MASVTKKIGNVRWGIAVLLGSGIVVNYLDRTNISVAGSQMALQYHWSATKLGLLLSAFFWTYTVMQIPMGAVLDRIGVKWLQRVSIVLWGLATIGTGFISGYGGIWAMRMILGITEAPAFMSASKATSYWFPKNERGLATSCFDGAAYLSSAIAAGVSTWAILNWGWRGAFFVTGAINLIFAAVYWGLYHDPEDHPKLTKEEYDYIKQGGAQEAGEEPGNFMENLFKLMGNRKVWGMAIAQAAGGYTFYLFLTWLPSYMTQQLHLTLATGGLFVAVPWLVATVFDFLVGGYAVDSFIKAGYNPSNVRRTIFIVGTLFGCVAMGLIPTSTNPGVQLLLLSLALGGLTCTSPIMWSIPGLIAPKGMVGSCGGFMNFVNNIAGVVAPIVTGVLIDATHSYNTGFVVAGVILFMGIIAFVWMLGDLNTPITFKEKADKAVA